MSDLAIVESRADRASVHICDHLRDLADWTERVDDSRSDADGGGTYYQTDGIELRTFEAFHLELERPAEAFDCDPDLLVFASRHSGDTGALLTGHFTGNFGPAEFGGEDNAVAETCPNALARLLEAFDEHAPEEYDVGMECTHHGPTDVGCPSLFAELGSGDEQWDDPAGAEAVARGILDLRDVAPHRSRQVVGFGGNHYAPRFGRIVRETPWAVGHIAADWGLEDLGHPSAHRDLLAAAFDASNTDIAVIDGDWPVLEETLTDLGYRLVSETWLREVGDRPLEVVDQLEATVESVDDGLRFGERRDDTFEIVSLPGDLIDTAEGIDPERVRDAVEARTIAFSTDNGGSRVGSTVAVPAGEPLETKRALLEHLVALLEEKYDTVRLTDDAVIATETAFNPERAATAGIPEGPKFGALAAGESVTVDGETITPERFQTERTDRFDL
ncbi:hypothetical protein G6M89_12035 [Natronolimnobius sp. AArcel1]|uniref:D-aminoacyl-tRNA deacylase n=1 Tax=Natronolimnobius sp. AArcel1 TaxID=1679093 RepID=UPI0013EBFEE4|nr:D-aminoacyl-tRNA deacylase [Natronolimnobius sp. AArcel1]NGM69729.1 hypothetical protein [Natronolimnobius sp. AArcel1]